MNKIVKDIFSYHDYREFLRDWFSYGRENQSRSIRDVAEACDISVGYLPMVLSNRRNLTEKSLLKLQIVLKLKQEELQYIKALLILSDSASNIERLNAFEEIKKLRSFKKKSSKELEVYKYLSNWLHVTIREMSMRRDFDPDPNWIRSRLVVKVPIRDIEVSLRFLIDQGFLVRGSDGRYVAANKQLDCFSGVYKLSLGEFHKQMFELAASSIDLTPRDQRNLLGHTLLIPENKIGELKSILDETLKKIEALESEFKEAGPVYHVILSTFPVAKRSEG